MINQSSGLTREEIRKIFIESSKPYWNFLVFVESLRRDDNNTLIESIKTGTVVMLEANYGSGNLPDELKKYDVSNDKINEIAERGAKEGGGLEITNPTEKTNIWVFIYKMAKSKMDRVMSKYITNQTQKDKLGTLEDGFGLMSDYLIKKAFSAYTPTKGKFTNFIEALINTQGVAQGFAFKAMGKTINEEWKPNEDYSIAKERGADQLNNVVVYYKSERNAPAKMYKRTVPESQIKDLNLLKAKNSKSENVKGIIDVYNTEQRKPEGKREFGKIDFEIPKELREYPPNSPEVSDYWVPTRTLEGRLSEDIRMNTSEEGGGDEDETKAYGRSVGYDEMSNKENLETSDKLKSFDIKEISKDVLGGITKDIQKNTMMNIINDDEVIDYISGKKGTQWEIIGNAIAKVFKEKYPSMGELPNPAEYTSESNKAYIATAYDLIPGNNPNIDQKEKIKWAEKIINSTRSAIEYAMDKIKERVKESILQGEKIPS